MEGLLLVVLPQFLSQSKGHAKTAELDHHPLLAQALGHGLPDAGHGLVRDAGNEGEQLRLLFDDPHGIILELLYDLLCPGRPDPLDHAGGQILFYGLHVCGEVDLIGFTVELPSVFRIIGIFSVDCQLVILRDGEEGSLDHHPAVPATKVIDLERNDMEARVFIFVYDPLYSSL